VKANPVPRTTARGTDAAVGAAVRAGPGAARHKFLIPTLHFQLGPAQIKKALAETMRRIGVTRRASDRAVEAAYAAQREFQEKLLAAGRRALARWNPPASRGWSWWDAVTTLRPRCELRHPAQAAPSLRRTSFRWTSW